MRADIMTWMQRLVAAVFAVGVLALVGAIVTLLRQSQGIPPLPVFIGVVGMVALILFAGGCLALMSIALSAKQSADALRKIANQPGASSLAPVAGKSQAARPFEGRSLREVMARPEPQPEPEPEIQPEPMAAPSRPVRPAGRVLVAER